MVAMVSRSPANPENVTPRRRYLHCLLSIDTQDPGLKLLYDGHWTKTQRVKQAWAGLECVAPRIAGAATMDTKIHWYAKQADVECLPAELRAEAAVVKTIAQSVTSLLPPRRWALICREPETRLSRESCKYYVIVSSSAQWQHRISIRYTFLFWIIGSFLYKFILWEIWTLLFTNEMFWGMW